MMNIVKISHLLRAHNLFYLIYKYIHIDTISMESSSMYFKRLVVILLIESCIFCTKKRPKGKWVWLGYTTIIHCRPTQAVQREKKCKKDCFYPSKQCRPRWNTALSGISPGSTLFAKVPVYWYPEGRGLMTVMKYIIHENLFLYIILSGPLISLWPLSLTFPSHVCIHLFCIIYTNIFVILENLFHSYLKVPIRNIEHQLRQLPRR